MRVLWILLAAAGLAQPVAAQRAPSPSAPQDPSYYFLLGRYLEGKGQIDAAIDAQKQAIGLAPDSAELRAELAGLYARQDRAVEALEAAEGALQKDPENNEANRILGSIYAALADQGQAIRPGDKPAQYAARAISALEKARRENAFDVSLELTLGRLYVQTGAFAKAVPILQRVVDDQPAYADGAFLLATAQEGAGAPADAIRTLERALRESPNFYRGQLRLAEFYDREQRWADAAHAYARAQSLNPRATALTGRRAAALINAGKPADAREILEKQLEKQPGSTDPMLLYLLAESQRATKDLTAAEGTAQKLLAANPKDVRGLHVLSVIQQEKGDMKGAERTLRDLIASDPVDANALNSLGYMLAERGDKLDEAVEFLQRALKIEPANPSYLDSLGWAYFQQGNLELADPPLTEAAAKLRDSSVVQDHLGDLRFKQKRYEDAASAWQRALGGDGRDIDRAKIEQKLRDARSRLEPK
jgi:tetratricopeptide (TPR) repeat protein